MSTEAPITAETPPSDTAPRSLRRVPLWVRLAVPVVLLALLWTLADGPSALERLGAVQWQWLLAALLAANLQIVLSALRWKLVARQLGMQIDTGAAIGEYYLAQLLNQTLPGGVVGDAARAVRSRHKSSLTRSTQAVVIERMAGQLALLAVMAIGFIWSVSHPQGIAWPVPSWQVAAAVAFAVSAGIAIIVAFRKHVPFLRSFGRATRDGLFAPGVRVPQILISLAIVACNLASFACCAAATATILWPEAIVTLIPLILTAMLVPTTIAGWGFREGAAAALFPLAMASASAGLAASLAFGLVILAASLPGLVVLLKRPVAS